MERRQGAQNTFGLECCAYWLMAIPRTKSLLSIDSRDPTMGENDWFGKTGRAGRVQYHQRVILCLFKDFIEFILSDLPIRK